MASTWISSRFGFVESFEAANKVIQDLEHETTSKFVTTRTTFPKSDIEDFTGKQRIRWEDTSGKDAVNLPFDGVPFIILGYQLRECQHGPDHHKTNKAKNQMAQEDNKDEHNYACRKKRRLLQDTRKLDCPARIWMRSVLKFPSFKIVGQDSVWKRKHRSKQLRQALRDNFDNVLRLNRVYILLPEPDDHQNHLTGEYAGLSQQNDPVVIKKIQELVGDGVRRVTEAKRLLEIFVRKDLFPGQDMNTLNRRYFPTDKDMRNHIHRALVMGRFSNDDQTNLKALVENWRRESPDDQFFYRTCTDVPEIINEQDEVTSQDGFLLVHQSAWQKKLLQQYGSEICMMDATYKTSRYDLPLFFICVNTNVGNTVVASFIVPTENRENISEALRIIAKWNPTWTPKHFMCDYDRREILAIENTFKECLVYICDFHREQAWGRWLQDSKNGLTQNQTEILPLLRKISAAKSEEDYQLACANLRSSQWWQNSSRLRTWFEKQWISQHKRWVQLYRSNLFNIRVNTTNGLERQHQELKNSYLVHYSEGTLSSMVMTLVKKFLPDSKKRYVEYNIRSLELYRRYANKVPPFLRNRPKMLVQHCLDRLPPYKNVIPPGNIIKQTEKSFLVKSIDSGETYEVDFGVTMPSCECGDWQKYHLPCKHMLAVFQHVPNFDWSALPDDYKNCPHFNLDVDFISTSQQQPNVPQHQPSSCNSPLATDKNTTSEDPAEVDIQNQCLTLIKNIEKDMYNVPDNKFEELKPIKEQLHDLYLTIRKLVPHKQGIPLRKEQMKRRPTFNKTKITGNGLRKTRKWRRKIFRRSTHSKLKNISKVIIDGTFGDTNEMFEDGVERGTTCTAELNANDPVHENNRMKDGVERGTTCTAELNANDPVHENNRMKDTIMKIWGSRDTTGNALGKIGPYILSDTSILYLRSQLSDEVIDAYLHLLSAKFRGVYHLDSITTTALFYSRTEVHGFLQQVDIYRFHSIIGAINEGGNHWTLMIISPKKREILYCNPLGELFITEHQILENWYSLMRERQQFVLDDQEIGDWNVIAPPHTKQRDSQSCGIYVLKIAESYLKGQSLMFSMTSVELLQYRREIALYLLSNIESIQDVQGQQDHIMAETVMDCGIQEKEKQTCDLRRKKSKRKRSSFIYPSLRKETRLYCKCQTPYDNKRFMVYCDGCVEWFHLDCLDLAIKDVPGKRKKFFCPECQSLRIVSHQPPEQNTNSTSGSIGIDEDQFNEMLKFLYSIMNCSDSKCDKLEHQRHHQFLCSPYLVHNTEKRKAGFGSERFTEEFRESFGEKLVDSLIIHKLRDPSKIYTGGRFSTIKNLDPKSKLWEFFLDQEMFATNYILDVIMKEGLIYMYITQAAGLTYRDANNNLLESETDFSYYT